MRFWMPIISFHSLFSRLFVFFRYAKSFFIYLFLSSSMFFNKRLSFFLSLYFHVFHEITLSFFLWYIFFRFLLPILIYLSVSLSIWLAEGYLSFFSLYLILSRYWCVYPFISLWRYLSICPPSLSLSLYRSIYFGLLFG